MLRLMRLICGPALPAGIFTVALGIVAAAAQGSPEVREACTGDAMQFCSEFIPDVPRVTRCMIAKRRHLSRECQVAMAREHRSYHYRDRRRLHHHS
jgi:hypothetical protein